MTDISGETPAENAATDGSEDARSDAIHVLARVLWRERLSLPPAKAENEGEREDATKLDRADWKEKRKDYIKLATRLYKRLDRNGATLTAPVAKTADDEGDAA